MYTINVQYNKTSDNKYFAILDSFEDYKSGCDDAICTRPICVLNTIWINRKFLGCDIRMTFDSVYSKTQTPYRKTVDKVKYDVEFLLEEVKKEIVNQKLKEYIPEIEKLISIQENKSCIE